MTIAALPDDAAAQAIAERRIDILVNLNGWFGLGRTGVFARRPAPVQVNYLGFPGTLGAPYLDVIVADADTIPAGEEGALRRARGAPAAQLPAQRPPARDRATAPSRADAGPARRRGRVRVLQQHLQDHAGHVRRRGCASSRPSTAACCGCCRTTTRPRATCGPRRRPTASTPSRLHFAPRIRLDEHLARHACADLFLDTLPYNAHTTASDALWAGLPVLSCRGTTFPGRVGASLLHALDLADELLVDDVAAYEARAIELARDPARLARVRERLAQARTHGAAVRHAGLLPAALEAGLRGDAAAAVSGPPQRGRASRRSCTTCVVTMCDITVPTSAGSSVGVVEQQLLRRVHHLDRPGATPGARAPAAPRARPPRTPPPAGR